MILPVCSICGEQLRYGANCSRCTKYDTPIKENLSSNQPTEIEQLRKEIHKLQDKNHIIEEHLKKQGVGHKIRKANAVGGVILMAIGIMMVTGGAGMLISSLCLGQSTYGMGGSCRGDMATGIAGIVIFWIGMIPTIFGVRTIAKA